MCRNHIACVYFAPGSPRKIALAFPRRPQSHKGCRPHRLWWIGNVHRNDVLLKKIARGLLFCGRPLCLSARPMFLALVNRPSKYDRIPSGIPHLTGSELPTVVAGTGAATCLCCTRLFLRRRGRAVAIGATVSRFPAGNFPCCASPAGGPSAWCWRLLLLHRAREPRGLTWSSRPDTPSPHCVCLGGVMSRCGPLPSGRRLFFFPLLPFPVESPAKAADSRDSVQRGGASCVLRRQPCHPTAANARPPSSASRGSVHVLQ